MKTKPWWKSKTMILNLLLATVSVIELNAGVFGEHSDWIIFGSAMLNLWLRVITTQGLSLADSK